MSLTFSQVAGLQTSKYFNSISKFVLKSPVGGVAILLYDYAITIEDEVHWVWGRKWDSTRCVFTVSRYLTFVGVGMTAYDSLRTKKDPCGPSLEENIIHIIGIVAAELLLVLRTYAFWQSNKWVLYGLLVYSVVTICMAITIKLLPSQWTIFPEVQPPPGCYLSAPRSSFLVYLLLLLFELVIFYLAAYKHFHSYRDVRRSLLNTVYLDSMFYITCIMLVTLANTLLSAISAFQFSDLLDTIQITLHSVLASRILFNLRKQSRMIERGDITTTDAVLSDIAFQERTQPRSIGSALSESRVAGMHVDVDANSRVDGCRNRSSV